MSNRNEGLGLVAIVIGLFNLIMNALLLFYFYHFMKWYIKGLFGKHFVWFWTATIIGFFIVKYDFDKADREYQDYQTKYGSKSGSELWDENMKDYDAVRGY